MSTGKELLRFLRGMLSELILVAVVHQDYSPPGPASAEKQAEACCQGSAGHGTAEVYTPSEPLTLWVRHPFCTAFSASLSFPLLANDKGLLEGTTPSILTPSLVL